MAVQPQVTAGGSRQRLLVLALAGVVAIGAALLAGALLLGREAADPAPAPAAGPATTATTRPTGPSTTAGPGQGELGATKDPFRPLVVPGGAATGAPAAAASPTTAPTVQGTVPGAGQGTATAPGGGATAEREVSLVEIVGRPGGRVAKVEVDGARYTVGEGERFAGRYRAVDVGSSCATFESGSTPFTLCEGEAVLK